uniref:CD82 molecule a n=1 Tax=Callorhinchus milii TaxID=7868 RepID=A0A4W3IM74_CALMI
MIGSPRELLNVCFVHINDVCLFVCLESSSSALKIGSYILLAVGCVTMVMGFLGCLGAVNEVKCLLGLYFTCLLLILIAQVTAGVLIYIQRHELRSEMSEIIHKMIVKYNPDEIQEKSFGQTWDYIQKKLKCCGWNGPSNWTENLVIKNSSLTLYPCSCQVNETVTNSGFCKGTYPAWPVNNKVSYVCFTSPSRCQTSLYNINVTFQEAYRSNCSLCEVRNSEPLQMHSYCRCKSGELVYRVH